MQDEKRIEIDQQSQLPKDEEALRALLTGSWESVPGELIIEMLSEFDEYPEEYDEILAEIGDELGWGL